MDQPEHDPWDPKHGADAGEKAEEASRARMRRDEWDESLDLGELKQMDRARDEMLSLRAALIDMVNAARPVLEFANTIDIQVDRLRRLQETINRVSPLTD